MNLMSPNVIRKEACSWAKGPSRLSKDPKPKRHPNTWIKDESKEVRDFMEMEEKGIHRKRYDGHCIKQWVKIPKPT
jgi:hypothetical protein